MAWGFFFFVETGKPVVMFVFVSKADENRI